MYTLMMAQLHAAAPPLVELVQEVIDSGARVIRAVTAGEGQARPARSADGSLALQLGLQPRHLGLQVIALEEGALQQRCQLGSGCDGIDFRQR